MRLELNIPRIGVAKQQGRGSAAKGARDRLRHPVSPTSDRDAPDEALRKFKLQLLDAIGFMESIYVWTAEGPTEVEIVDYHWKRTRQWPRSLKPMHPGEVLREEFLVPLKMSAGSLAKACGLPCTRIERIASEQTGITAKTALRLAKALGTTAQLWLNLQNDHDVQIAKRDLGKILDRIETVNKPKAA